MTAPTESAASETAPVSLHPSITHVGYTKLRLQIVDWGVNNAMGGQDEDGEDIRSAQNRVKKSRLIK